MHLVTNSMWMFALQAARVHFTSTISGRCREASISIGIHFTRLIPPCYFLISRASSAPCEWVSGQTLQHGTVMSRMVRDWCHQPWDDMDFKLRFYQNAVILQPSCMHYNNNTVGVRKLQYLPQPHISNFTEMWFTFHLQYWHWVDKTTRQGQGGDL